MKASLRRVFSIAALTAFAVLAPTGCGHREDAYKWKTYDELRTECSADVDRAIAERGNQFDIDPKTGNMMWTVSGISPTCAELNERAPYPILTP